MKYTLSENSSVGPGTMLLPFNVSSALFISTEKLRVKVVMQIRLSGSLGLVPL